MFTEKEMLIAIIENPTKRFKHKHNENEVYFCNDCTDQQVHLVEIHSRTNFRNNYVVGVFTKELTEKVWEEIGS